jgi:hypothetical protein
LNELLLLVYGRKLLYWMYAEIGVCVCMCVPRCVCVCARAIMTHPKREYDALFRMSKYCKYIWRVCVCVCVCMCVWVCECTYVLKGGCHICIEDIVRCCAPHTCYSFVRRLLLFFTVNVQIECEVWGGGGKKSEEREECVNLCRFVNMWVYVQMM